MDITDIINRSPSDDVSDKMKNATIDKSKITATDAYTAKVTEQEDQVFCVKRILHNQARCGIVTQSRNGPCPLLAIVNVLLLRGKLSLPEECKVISAEELLNYLADLLISLGPEDQNHLADFQQNKEDAFKMLPSLATGMDVNLRFAGVSDFVYTQECIIFDLLHISLYHGWLVDPQAGETWKVVNRMSYNQLLDTIVINRSSEDNSKASESMIAKMFLEDTATQLTYHGLCELNTTMKEGQLAVFFRNNHFSTIFKHWESLYLLNTDEGLLDNIDTVWETLDDITGDTVHVNHEFRPVEQGGESVGVPVEDLQQAGEADHHKAGVLEHLAGDTQGLADSELAGHLEESVGSAKCSIL